MVAPEEWSTFARERGLQFSGIEHGRAVLVHHGRQSKPIDFGAALGPIKLIVIDEDVLKLQTSQPGLDLQLECGVLNSVVMIWGSHPIAAFELTRLNKAFINLLQADLCRLTSGVHAFGRETVIGRLLVLDKVSAAFEATAVVSHLNVGRDAVAEFGSGSRLGYAKVKPGGCLGFGGAVHADRVEMQPGARLALAGDLVHQSGEYSRIVELAADADLHIEVEGWNAIHVDALDLRGRPRADINTKLIRSGNDAGIEVTVRSLQPVRAEQFDHHSDYESDDPQHRHPLTLGISVEVLDESGDADVPEIVLGDGHVVFDFADVSNLRLEADPGVTLRLGSVSGATISATHVTTVGPVHGLEVVNAIEYAVQSDAFRVTGFAENLTVSDGVDLVATESVSDSGGLRVLNIATCKDASLSNIVVSSQMSFRSLNAIEASARWVPIVSPKPRISGRRPRIKDNGEQALFWTRLARITQDKAAHGHIQSQVRFRAADERRLAASSTRERIGLGLYRLVGYGERIGAPLAWFLALAACVSLGVKSRPFSMELISRAELWTFIEARFFPVLLSPFVFFRAGVDPIEGLQVWEQLAIIAMQLGGVVLLFFSLTALRRVTKAGD